MGGAALLLPPLTIITILLGSDADDTCCCSSIALPLPSESILLCERGIGWGCTPPVGLSILADECDLFRLEFRVTAELGVWFTWLRGRLAMLGSTLGVYVRGVYEPSIVDRGRLFVGSATDDDGVAVRSRLLRWLVVVIAPCVDTWSLDARLSRLAAKLPRWLPLLLRKPPSSWSGLLPFCTWNELVHGLLLSLAREALDLQNDSNRKVSESF